MTGGDGLRHRHAGHRCGCPPSADHRHGDRHRGPRCDGNRRTVAWRRPADHPARPRPPRRELSLPSADPGGRTACRNWTRGPGTSLIATVRRERASPARTAPGRPAGVSGAPWSPRLYPAPPGRPPPPADGPDLLAVPARGGPGAAEEPRPSKSPASRGCASRARNRQNRRGTGLSPSSGGPSSGQRRQLAGQAGRTGMGRRGRRAAAIATTVSDHGVLLTPEDYAHRPARRRPGLPGQPGRTGQPKVADRVN